MNGDNLKEVFELSTETLDLTPGKTPMPNFGDIVIEFHYDDGDIGAHYGEALERLLWTQFSNHPSHNPVKIVIRPVTEQD